MTVASPVVQAGAHVEVDKTQLADGQKISSALELKHVSAGYGQRRAIEDLTVEVQAGKRVGLIGPNGAGKSTLFRSIVGLLPLMSGQVLIQNRTEHRARRQVAYVPQFEDVDWNFPAAVIDVVI